MLNHIVELSHVFSCFMHANIKNKHVMQQAVQVQQ